MSSFATPDRTAAPRDFAIEHPRSLAEAAALLAKLGPDAHVLAGGTDVVPLLRDGLLAPSALVSLRRVGGLDGISAAGGVRLGARVTLQQLASDPQLARVAQVLARACDSAATPQVRNMATIGGNLLQRPRCWYFRGAFDCLKKGGDRCFAVEGESAYHAVVTKGPCHIVHPSDPASALVALDARIHLVGVKGPRTLPLADFFAGPEVDVRRENVLGPAELIEAVSFVPLAAADRGAFFKVGRRADFTFATVNVAVVLRNREARIVLGGVAPIPWRATAAEAVLAGKSLTPALARAAAQAALADAKPLKHNAYKVPLAQALIERALISTLL